MERRPYQRARRPLSQYAVAQERDPPAWGAAILAAKRQGRRRGANDCDPGVATTRKMRVVPVCGAVAQERAPPVGGQRSVAVAQERDPPETGGTG